MTKILLPIDGSPRSARTAAMLRQMFDPSDVEVTLVTVIVREIRSEVSQEYEKVFHAEQAKLDNMRDELPLYTVKTKILAGAPGPEIVRYAKKEKFDLIMMTRSSRAPLRRMGSVATYIVKKAPYIDLIIMHEAHESKEEAAE